MTSSLNSNSVTYGIADLLPHAPPMLWLDELLELGPDYIVARVAIREDALLYEPGLGMPSWVGVEYMAQAVAALSGFEDRERGLAPAIGLLLGCRRYQCSRTHFPGGKDMRVRADLKMRDESNLVAFDCTLSLDGIVVAGADLKAIRPHDLKFVLDRAPPTE